MGSDVYANGRGVSCKSGSGKTIANFPDVCMTPPENPATPPGVPVPYPNTGMSGDCTSGSRSVKISGKEVSLKNKSYFKKSMGDEAGAAAKKGVVSSKNRGKVYYTSWSMDVKCEGENCVRHLDLTTHNHGSPTNTCPMPFTDDMFLMAMEAWGEAHRRTCECCGNDAHSLAQAAGNEISEDEFYGAHPDGPTWLAMARDNCPSIVPEAPPTDDPCAKYYGGITSTKAPRAEFSQAGANPLSNPNSLPWVHGQGQMAHRVPLSAGGCPIGQGNLAPVRPGTDCKTLEDMSSDIHDGCRRAHVRTLRL